MSAGESDVQGQTPTSGQMLTTGSQIRTSSAWVQPSTPLRPVPREGFHAQPTRQAANPRHPGWDLRWRRSANAPQSAPARVAATVARPAAEPLEAVHNSPAKSAAHPGRPVTSHDPAMVAPAHHNGLQVANHPPELRPVSGEASGVGVAQTAYLTHPERVAMMSSDEELQGPGNLVAPANVNHFQDPFGDRETRFAPPQSTSPSAVAQGEMQIPAPANGRAQGGAFAIPDSLAPDTGVRVAQIELTPPAPEEAPLFTPPTVPDSPAEAQIKPWSESEIQPTQPTDRGLQFQAPSTPDPAASQDAPLLPSPANTPPAPAVQEATTKSQPAAQVQTPSNLPTTNQLRSAPPAAKPPAMDNGPTLGDIIGERTPGGSKQDSGTTPGAPPQIQGSPFDSPFEGMNADERDRDRLNSGDDGESGRYGSKEDVRKLNTFSCDVFRQRIAEQTIDQVSLDISPPYRPDEMDDSRYERLKSKFEEKQTIRTWRNLRGEPIASGRLRDLAYEQAVIETESGQKEALPINRLSEGDIAYIAENWGLPKECLLEQVASTPRNWIPMTMTWKASNLCHNPLYFEDVNLERYGHTHGPVLEPVVQSAHFFANIAVLPYKMGVHCPSECQYALGYYRPGNCAPWITPPVPISARGAIAQAATMTGLFWLIP